MHRRETQQQAAQRGWTMGARVFACVFAGLSAAGALAEEATGLPAVAIPLSTDSLPLAAKIQARKYLGDINDDLTFTPVTPCRLADTRNAGGPLGPRSARAFSATSNTLIAAAGGNAAGCGVPAGPTALALTLTVVVPAQTGNLIAYAEATPVPLSSALNFLAGQIIANTTVVPSTSTAGLNFDIFNNSDGSTHTVIDIVGYFYAPMAPDCIASTQTASPANAATFSATASCSSGYRITMGGCATTATAAGTDWQIATYNASNDGWVCAGHNDTGAPATITSQAWCCRKPGR